MSAPNIVLIGMRASGKSTLGRSLAAHTARPFVDLDEELGRRAECEPDRFLADQGEAAFRSLERDVLEWAASLRGHVVATGGGAVLHATEFQRLARTSTVVYLEVSAAELVRRCRSRPRTPLSKTPLETEVRVLLEAREPLYRAAADMTIPAGSPNPILAVLEQLSGPVDER